MQLKVSSVFLQWLIHACWLDILTPLPAMGIEFDIVKNVGPVISNPISSMQDITVMRELTPEMCMSSLPFIAAILKVSHGYKMWFCKRFPCTFPLKKLSWIITLEFSRRNRQSKYLDRIRRISVDISRLLRWRRCDQAMRKDEDFVPRKSGGSTYFAAEVDCISGGLCRVSGILSRFLYYYLLSVNYFEKVNK